MRSIDALSKEEHTAFCAVVGRMLLNSPRAALLAGHENLFGTLVDYLRITGEAKNDAEKIVNMATEFLCDVAQMAMWRKKMTIQELADKWSPPDTELVKDL